jgi:hypothetical protein
VPELAVKSGSGNEKRPVYFTELQTPPAEAVITKVKGSQVELWLGGLDSQSLQAFAGGAILSIVDNAGREQGLVQLDSRRALVGQGKVLNASRDAVQPGALLQERVRGIPKNVSLRIGLDLSLGKDLTAAIQALQAIKGIEALPLQHTGIDYILGRITPSSQQEVPQSEEALPPIGSIGLFLPGLALVPDSFGTTGETVRDAVTRLKAKLKSLLAVRLLKLALNTNSSRLNVAAGMILDNKQQSVIGKVVSVRGASKQLRLNRGIEQQNSLSPRPVATPVATAQRSVTPLTPGTPVRFYFTNDEPRELYCCIVVISSTGEIAVLFPNQWTVAEDVVRVGAGQTLQVPDLGKDDFSFVAQGPHGVLEVLIIASSKPLRNGLKALRVIASSRGHRHGPIAFDTPDDPMDVIASLLDDLDMSAARNTEPSIHRLDVTQLAVMSISAEVI